MSNEACYVVIKFKGDETNWIHPIQLNGRVIEALYVDGERHVPIHECEFCKWIVKTSNPITASGYWCSENDTPTGLGSFCSKFEPRAESEKIRTVG